VLLIHLLKWQIQPFRRSMGWRGTIVEQRRRILSGLARNPNLVQLVPELVGPAYDRARDVAVAQTNIAVAEFPTKCPYEIREILDLGFFPE
jgi:Domain of unknown function DUF29